METAQSYNGRLRLAPASICPNADSPFAFLYSSSNPDKFLLQTSVRQKMFIQLSPSHFEMIMDKSSNSQKTNSWSNKLQVCMFIIDDYMEPMKRWYDLFHSRSYEAISAVYIPSGLIIIIKGLMTKRQWHRTGRLADGSLMCFQDWLATVVRRSVGDTFPGRFLFYCIINKESLFPAVIFLVTCRLIEAVMLTREGISIWGIKEEGDSPIQSSFKKSDVSDIRPLFLQQDINPHTPHYSRRLVIPHQWKCYSM
jgi:hypothetical protein